MTLQELLQMTPTPQFVEYYIGFDEVPPESQDIAREKLAVVVDKMKAKQVPASGDVLLGRNEPQGEGLEYDVSLYLEPEIAAWRADGMRCDLTDDFTFDSYQELMAVFPKLPEHYAFEFSEWDKILGAQVYLPNVKGAGELKFLSAVFYEMTFFGLSEERHKERVAEMEAELLESEKQLEDPEYREQCTSLDELLEEFGIEREKPTPEEEAERHRKACEEMLLMAKERYATLKGFVQTLPNE